MPRGIRRTHRDALRPDHDPIVDRRPRARPHDELGERRRRHEPVVVAEHGEQRAIAASDHRWEPRTLALVIAEFLVG